MAQGLIKDIYYSLFPTLDIYDSISKGSNTLLLTSTGSCSQMFITHTRKHMHKLFFFNNVNKNLKEDLKELISSGEYKYNFG